VEETFSICHDGNDMRASGVAVLADAAASQGPQQDGANQQQEHYATMRTVKERRRHAMKLPSNSREEEDGCQRWPLRSPVWGDGGRFRWRLWCMVSVEVLHCIRPLAVTVGNANVHVAGGQTRAGEADGAYESAYG